MTNDEVIRQLIEIIMTADCDFSSGFFAAVDSFIDKVYSFDMNRERLLLLLLKGRLSHGEI